jgi:hypothetical protein
MPARQEPQSSLLLHRWLQKSQAAALLTMQVPTTLSKARAEGCVDPEHCCAAPTPSPTPNVVMHDAHLGKEAHCCLKNVHRGKDPVPPQSFTKSLSSARLVPAVHAGERNTSALVPL